MNTGLSYIDIHNSKLEVVVTLVPTRFPLTSIVTKQVTAVQDASAIASSGVRVVVRHWPCVG